ncbi:MAG: hypothetical protein ABI550_03830 [Ignavibacteriaceae bacterium]
MFKTLKKCLKNIICISFLFSGLANAQIVFTPFQNNSSYKGTWKLENDVPNYIAAYLREFHSVDVLSAGTYLSLASEKTNDKSLYSDLEFISQFASEYDFKYAATGKINSFNISRFTAGEPLIAGYESYNCEIEIFIQFFNLQTNTSEFIGTVKGEVTDKGLGLTLLGKPTEEKKEYFALNSIQFGGEEFNQTIVGETIFQLCQNLTKEIQSKKNNFLNITNQNRIKLEIPDKSLEDIKLNTEIKKGQILTYDESTGEAFVNLGSANNVWVGEELSIYTLADSLYDPSSNEFLGVSDKKISILEIIEVRGEKLSLAVVKSNRDKVKEGMEVRKLILKKKK